MTYVFQRLNENDASGVDPNASELQLQEEVEARTVTADNHAVLAPADRDTMIANISRLYRSQSKAVPCLTALSDDELTRLYQIL